MRPATTATACVAGFVLLALPRAGDGQTRQTAPANRAAGLVVTPGPRYQAGSYTRVILGSGWRDVWTTAVRAPVLDLATYAGGLKLKERGGGFHSLVLHLEEENGWREYRFRSVDKFPMQGMPAAIKGTAVGRVFEDQVSIMFPAAPLLVPPLLESIGALHVRPELYVMGDSPRLEHVRDTVAGMLGTMELKAEEAPDDKPGFAGSRAIKDTEGFFEDLASGRAHRLDEREFLAVRLVDFLINDPDRTPDNFDWARFGEKGAYTWRPIPRDRDQAFVDARGLVNALVIRPLFPKVVEFTPAIPLKGLVYVSHALDRRLLQRLTAEDFRAVAAMVRMAVQDSVIAQVVAAIPEPWRVRTAADERIRTVLRARRDQLPEAAMAFYRDLASDVDIRGTDEPDRFEVVRHVDGRVTVIVTDPEQGPATVVRREDGRLVTTSDGSVASDDVRGPYYSRTFVPGETDEVRLYAGGGDDVAVVRGAPSDAIKVRVIGGKGDDILADSAGGRGTFLYDAEGRNRLVTSRGTHTSARPWKAPKPPNGFRLGGAWRPDWGGSSGWGAVIDHEPGAGIILGAGPRLKSYGFRRLPYHWRAGANLLVGTENGRLGLTADADYRAENSPLMFEVASRATQLEPTRFYGYGNDSPDIGSDGALVEQTVLALELSLVRQVGWRTREGSGNPLLGDEDTHTGLRPLFGELRVGPVLRWIDPDPDTFSPLRRSGVVGAEDFGLVGARFGVELDRTDSGPVPTRGWTVEADLAGFAPVSGVDAGFGTATAGGAVYVPIVRDGLNMALRARGAVASDESPVQFAPSIGGRSTVRGYPWRRFVGDAAVSGGAELRAPVGTVNFLIRSQLGLFALADAGRVWFDGDSDGGWHTGVGAGFWLAALGRAVSVTYAYGDTHKVYLKSGLSY